jgi:putative peptidoglycan lipid II flippase
VVAIGSIIVKCIATGKEVVVASLFGRSSEIDAFIVAFLIPSFIINVIGVSLNPALIPTYIEVERREGKESANRLLASASLCTQAILLAFSVGCALVVPLALHAVMHDFGPAHAALSTRLFYVMLPNICLTGLVTNWGAILNARRRFILPSLSPALTPLATLLLLLVLGGSWSVWSLAVGTAIGAATEALLLGLSLRRQGINVLPRWYGLTPNLRVVLSQYLPATTGAFLCCGLGLVDQSMAAMFLHSGSVAALAYGGRIISVIVSLGAVSLSSAVMPYFSDMAARQDWNSSRHTLKTYTRLILLTSIPIMLVFLSFSVSIVRILYQRGAFDATDTAVVAKVQAMYAIQIPFYILSILFVRFLSSIRRNDVLMYAAGINLSLDIVFNLVLVGPMGVAGIALSTSLFYVASCSFLAYFVFRAAPQRGTAATPLVEVREQCV